MKKTTVSGILLALLLTGVLALAFDIQVKAQDGTVYIRADGSVDPPTAPISTEDNVTYILTGNITSGADGIVIERNNTVFDGAGYTILGTGYNGTGYYSGISLSGRSNVTVKNTRITAFWWGIHLNSSFGNSIRGNTMTANSQCGIGLYNSSNNSLSGNNITDNFIGISLFYSSDNNSISGNNITTDEGIGINVYYSNDNSINGNAFVGCGLVVYDSYGSVVVDNLVNRKPLVYLEGASDVAVEDAGQVVLVNCTRIRVENLSLSNTTAGVHLWGTSNTTISGNNITDNFYGIMLDYSFNNSISGNAITDNFPNGIFLGESSDNNNISGNNIAKNYCGIELFSSDNSSISGNDMANNLYGIRASSSSDNSSISGNNIVNDVFGIGISCSSSSDNSIYHNNFDVLSYQVGDGSNNVWDDSYPSCGNYWSKYKGTDLFGGPYQNETGSDGIGDTPYVIDENNTDHYPLMGMFSDFNATSEQHVQTICNSSITDFQFNGTALSFKVSGEDDTPGFYRITAGFCRMRIPTALMNGPYMVLVNSTEVSYILLPCSNETYSYLYFNYTHSTQQVIVIAEFQSLFIIPLFMMATLFGVKVYRKRARIVNP